MPSVDTAHDQGADEMSDDRTWYSVTAYLPAPAGLEEVDTLLGRLGIRRDPPHPTS